jgi:hypothetical protein
VTRSAERPQAPGDAEVEGVPPDSWERAPVIGARWPEDEAGYKRLECGAPGLPLLLGVRVQRPYDSLALVEKLAGLFQAVVLDV